MSILIKDVLLFKEKTHIYIEGNRISEIGKKVRADVEIDGRGLAAFPGLVNTHTHLAMTLLRGYGDDMPLMNWLQNRIWPAEAKLTAKDVYLGSKLGLLEMIKGGTTTFVDMYFHTKEVAKAAKAMGLRGFISEGFIDLNDKEKREKSIKETEKSVRDMKNLHCSRIYPSIGPHAIYTVSSEAFQWCAEYARENEFLFQYHLSETKGEVEDCKKAHGVSPAKYLKKLGALQPRSVAAHGVWLNKAELGLLAKNGVSVSNNPCSNQKLGVGKIFPYQDTLDKGVNLTIGTDGTASNNNLDMLESMKFAALQAKLMGTPSLMDAYTTYECATKNGANALGLDAGEIKEGKLADIILLDLKSPEMAPQHDVVSNLVYSASRANVHTTICDGKVLMDNYEVKGEDRLVSTFTKAAHEMAKRVK